MSIYNNPHFLFPAGSRKGKTRKSIEENIERQQKRNARGANPGKRDERVVKPSTAKRVILRKGSQK